MPQSFAQVFVHLVFSTKNREPFITDELRPELNAYIVGILKNVDCTPVITNTVDDHVHILFSLSKNHALKWVISEIKTGSSKWVKTKGESFRSFYWQNGYGAFSVSKSNLEVVESYVANQEERHRKVSFQDELRKILEKHGVQYDERYLWD